MVCWRVDGESRSLGQGWLCVPDTAGAFAAECPAPLKWELERAVIKKTDFGSAIPAWFRADDCSWVRSVHKINPFCLLGAMYSRHHQSIPETGSNYNLDTFREL
jgi:hypothetical protein